MWQVAGLANLELAILQKSFVHQQPHDDDEDFFGSVKCISPILVWWFVVRLANLVLAKPQKSFVRKQPVRARHLHCTFPTVTGRRIIFNPKEKKSKQLFGPQQKYNIHFHHTISMMVTGWRNKLNSNKKKVKSGAKITEKKSQQDI